MGKLLTGDTTESHLNIVAYGKSGTGKTTLGVTAPKPFILLSERQGYQSVKDAARRLGVETPPVLYLETLDDIRACMRALKGGSPEPIAVALREVLCDRDAKGNPKKNEELDKQIEAQIASLPYLKPETVVCDSITDFCVLISNDILRAMDFPVSSSDGLEVKPDRYWGLLRDRSERMLRELRDLPYHVLFLALLDDRTIGEGEEKSRIVGPDTPMRKIPHTMIASSNACCLMYLDQQAKRVEDPADGEKHFDYEFKRLCRFAAPSYVTTKMIEPLKAIEEPDFGDWVQRIHEHAASQKAEEVPKQEPKPKEAKSGKREARSSGGAQ